MEKTKKIDVFNKTPRKIKCITNEMDYLGDGTIFREDKLVVGQLYTLIETSMESYGSVVYLKEIPSNMGIQSCMFEELEEYDFVLLRTKSEEWLQDVLEESEKEIQNGEYLSAKEALAIFREHLEKNYCDTCGFFYHSEDMLDGDFVCVNAQSENLADYVSRKDTCDKWERRDFDV